MNMEIVQTMRVLADIGEIAGIVFWDLNSANLHTD